MKNTEHKIDCKEINVGDIMAFVYYTKVAKVNGDELIVTGLDNNIKDIKITGKEIIENSFSADQFHEEREVTKTQAAEILVHSPNRPLSVSFTKQDGTERVIRGRLIKPEPLLGRSMVEDLESKDISRLRQVDHRTINWLIVDCVKYVTK